MKARHEAWFELQPDLDPAKLLRGRDRGHDEDGAPARTQPARRALPGSGAAWPLEDYDARRRAAPRGLSAPMLIDGAMDGATFAAWVERLLVPTLDQGDIVILDNLPAHKLTAARAAIERRGDAAPAAALQPRLQSDGAGIRQAEGAAAQGRCTHLDALERAIAEALAAFTPAECANYFTNSGYEPD